MESHFIFVSFHNQKILPNHAKCAFNSISKRFRNVELGRKDSICIQIVKISRSILVLPQGIYRATCPMYHLPLSSPSEWRTSTYSAVGCFHDNFEPIHIQLKDVFVVKVLCWPCSGRRPYNGKRPSMNIDGFIVVKSPAWIQRGLQQQMAQHANIGPSSGRHSSMNVGVTKWSTAQRERIGPRISRRPNM